MRKDFAKKDLNQAAELLDDVIASLKNNKVLKKAFEARGLVSKVWLSL